jgi:DNA-binding NtrC family response regulator
VKTVLVVDDERLIRWSLEQSLCARYRVLTAGDVDAALAVLAREPVDVLITDLKMPGRDGMELVRHVRSAYPATKVFVITAYGTDETVERCHVLEVDGYVRKPFELRLIRDLVGLHLAPSP